MTISTRPADHPEFTPEQFKSARKDLGLSLSVMAELLGYSGRHRADTQKALESGKKTIMPAQARLMRAYQTGYRPKDWPH